MAKNVVRQIRKATRRRFSAEEKIRIVLEGLRDQWGEESSFSGPDTAPLRHSDVAVAIEPHL